MRCVVLSMMELELMWCEIAVSIIVVVFTQERGLRGVNIGMNQKCDIEAIWKE